MIVELIVSGFTALVVLLFGWIPSMPIPFDSILSDFADLLGSQLGGLDSFLPISELATPISWLLVTYVPFYLTFLFVRWVYAKIPVFGQ